MAPRGGLTNRAATLARALIIPFVVAYTALDAVLGIAWGIAAETANDLPAADQPGAGRLVDELVSGDPDPRGLILYWGAGLLWLAVALTVVTALRDTAPLGALVCCHSVPRCSRSVTPHPWVRSGWA